MLNFVDEILLQFTRKSLNNKSKQKTNENYSDLWPFK